MRLPEFGIRLSGAIDPRRCIALAQAAEDSGFVSLWFAENPFQRGVMATAGACAAATKRVRIGVGVINPFGRHPTMIAMELAALDQLAGGRVAAGIGSGIGGAVQRMGYSYDRPVTAVREATTIVRAMLAGEKVTYRGRMFDITGAQLGFRILRPDLPIYVAAAGMRGLRTCGEIADGLVVSNLTPPRTTERLVSIVGEAAERAGRPMPRIVQYVPCTVREDGDVARAEVKIAIGEMLMSFWPGTDEWPLPKEGIVDESGIPRRDFVRVLNELRRGVNPDGVLDERFIAAFAIAGTAEECLGQASGYRCAGVDELALTFAGSNPVLDMAYLGRRIRAAQVIE